MARGRDSLFGKVVTWGEHWTPGANWATTIDVDHDIRLNGRRWERPLLTVAERPTEEECHG